MPLTISIINQKGGVGKTTSAINLSAFMTLYDNMKVLLIDLDPQGNSTDTLCPNLDQDNLQGTYDFFMSQIGTNKPAFKDLIQSPEIKKSNTTLDVMKANIRLSEIEITLANQMNREKAFSRAFNYYKDDLEKYNLILIDCPPSLGLLTINAFLKSDYLLIPVDASVYSHKGLIELTNSFKRCNETFESNIKFLGIFFAKYNRNETIYKESYDFLKSEIGDYLIDTVIHKSTKIEQAPHHNQTIIDYAPNSTAFNDYEQLCQTILARIETYLIKEGVPYHELQQSI